MFFVIDKLSELAASFETVWFSNTSLLDIVAILNIRYQVRNVIKAFQTFHSIFIGYEIQILKYSLDCTL